MVGNSPPMLGVFKQIRRIAESDLPVLITGEPGTGKKLAARTIHDLSQRTNGPFVAVNCAGEPTQLIYELFGQDNGGVPGAPTRKSGQIEAAHSGTLFLEAIDEMPIDLQGVLLPLLEHGEIGTVGGRRPVKVDVRVITTTNLLPQDAIEVGRLLVDLYYRLNVLSLHLPPLRDRSGDLEVLTRHFLPKIAQDAGREITGLTPAASAALTAYAWPGNVREFIATLHRAVGLAVGPLLAVGDLDLKPSEKGRASRYHPGLRSTSRRVPSSIAERRAVVRALRLSGFNISRAAQLMGVARPTFYKMLRRNQIALQHLKP